MTGLSRKLPGAFIVIIINKYNTSKFKKNDLFYLNEVNIFNTFNIYLSFI